MKRIFVSTKSGTDWQDSPVRPELHWKKGGSAMSVAACWEDAHPKLPSEIVKVLGVGDKLELLAAFPNWKVPLPSIGGHPQIDVLAITTDSKRLVILGVDAKVSGEGFGSTIETEKQTESSDKLKRISCLKDELGLTDTFDGKIPYQLLHRTVSTIITARKFHAAVAVMLVHSFCPNSTRRNDFEQFIQALNCKRLNPDLYEAPNIKGPKLLLGWCKGDEKYLEADLSNSMLYDDDERDNQSSSINPLTEERLPIDDLRLKNSGIEYSDIEWGTYYPAKVLYYTASVYGSEVYIGIRKERGKGARLSGEEALKSMEPDEIISRSWKILNYKKTYEWIDGELFCNIIEQKNITWP